MINASLPNHQKGTILITVMLLFAIGAYMAAEITYRQQIDIQRTLSLSSRIQGYEYVVGAEEIAQFALRKDLKRDNKKNKSKAKDHSSEDWGVELNQVVEGGSIEGKMEDLQGRFNLNWLLEPDQQKRAGIQDALVKLMGYLKVPKKGSAKIVVTQIVDWLDEDSTPTGTDGMEDQELMLEEPPRRSANRLFFDVSELMLISALTPEDVDTLAPYVTTLPYQTKLNLNTVSDEVLASFDCLDAQTIIKGRPKKGYVKYNDAIHFVGSQQCKAIQNNYHIGTDIRSEFYELTATSNLHGNITKIKSIIYRDNDQDKDIKVKVIYRRQVDPYS